MAANSQRSYESELDMNVWRFGGQCPTCSGVLKYQYFHTQKKELTLKVMPNKKRFEVHEKKIFGNRPKNTITIQGSIENMKTLLAAV